MNYSLKANPMKKVLQFLVLLFMMGESVLYAQHGVPGIDTNSVNSTRDGIVFVPDTVDLGFRPNGAWMRPATLSLTNNADLVEVQSIEVSNSYFQLDLGTIVVPFSIDFQQSLEIEVGTGTATAGIPVNAQITATYQYDMVATAYVTAIPYLPVARDVWETANQVTLPFTDNLVSSTIPLYNNYKLQPVDVPDGPDAVYKLVFTQDAYLNASVTGEMAKCSFTTRISKEKVALWKGTSIQVR